MRLSVTFLFTISAQHWSAGSLKKRCTLFKLPALQCCALIVSRKVTLTIIVYCACLFSCKNYNKVYMSPQTNTSQNYKHHSNTYIPQTLTSLLSHLLKPCQNECISNHRSIIMYKTVVTIILMSASSSTT